MRRLDTETKRKLREMGATALLEACEAQDEALAPRGESQWLQTRRPGPHGDNPGSQLHDLRHQPP